MVRNCINAVLYGVMAGILISIGGSIYLASSNKYVGAVLFCVALICICYKGYYLFTGKVGYIVEDHKKEDFVNLIMCLIGNAIGTVIIGEILRFAMPSYQETAYIICSNKLEDTFLQWLVKGIMCGLLMYLAVSVFKEHNKNIIGIIFCIPTFILAGFEHSIADMYYFSVSGIATAKAVGFVFTIILGNGIGAIILPMIKLLIKEKKEDKSNNVQGE